MYVHVIFVTHAVYEAKKLIKKNLNSARKNNERLLSYVLRYLIPIYSHELIIRLILQGTVDNNLGPDSLLGPNALDPNYYRQLTL